MLDAFIIEEIRRRERLRQEQERPFVELPVPEAPPARERRQKHAEDEEGDKPQRGVVVLDM